MEYKLDFNADTFPAWGQARQILDRILEEDKGEEFERFLEDIYCGEMPREVDINDFLAYDWETIYEALGISDEDEDEEESYEK